MSDNIRAMTLRLPEELAARLDLVAIVDRAPITSEVLAAIEHHIGVRTADPAFQAALRAHITDAQTLLGASDD